jgi:peptide-methionine (R)-S-oxide reductase
MPRHRQLFWAVGSAAAMVLLTVSIVMAAQDPFQQAEKSAAKDPFEVVEKGANKGADKKAAKKVEPEFVHKSLLEWQRILPRGVFEVTRLKATEPAFTGKYASGHFHGTFVCACCDAELFSSQAKFESGTGWPSFWQPIKLQAIDRAIDNSDAEPRIEVMCHRCGAHLGHVFDDGPPPTGLRFCINSLSLKLEKPDGDTAKPASTKAKAKTKVKTTRTRSRTASRSTPTRSTAKTAKPDSQEPSDEKPDGAEAPAKGKTDGT